MKFTSKDLMKAMGLQVGDRVIINDNKKPSYEVIKEQNIHELKSINLETKHPLYYLINTTYEILPKPKRVGDLKCVCDCTDCPLIAICAMYDTFELMSLYEVLEHNNTMAQDQEIYDLLKARLDKEVKEC